MEFQVISQICCKFDVSEDFYRAKNLTADPSLTLELMLVYFSSVTVNLIANSVPLLLFSSSSPSN